jgi:hypothetical protein
MRQSVRVCVLLVCALRWGFGGDGVRAVRAEGGGRVQNCVTATRNNAHDDCTFPLPACTLRHPRAQGSILVDDFVDLFARGELTMLHHVWRGGGEVGKEGLSPPLSPNPSVCGVKAHCDYNCALAARPCAAVFRTLWVVADQELQQLVVETDSDGNGAIDFEEFCIIMSRLRLVGPPPNSTIATACRAPPPHPPLPELCPSLTPAPAPIHVPDSPC